MSPVYGAAEQCQGLGGYRCTNHFSCVCDQIPDRSFTREEGLAFDSQIGRLQSAWLGIAVTMVCGSWPPSSHHQQADKDDCWCLTGCLSCILSEIPVHRAVPPLIKETTLLSQSFWETPSQSHQGFNSMMIPNPANLTMKSNPRTTKPSNAELLRTSLRHT